MARPDRPAGMPKAHLRRACARITALIQRKDAGFGFGCGGSRRMFLPRIHPLTSDAPGFAASGASVFIGSSSALRPSWDATIATRGTASCIDSCLGSAVCACRKRPGLALTGWSLPREIGGPGTDGRGSWIRTNDLQYPKLPRYQAALYPDLLIADVVHAHGALSKAVASPS